MVGKGHKCIKFNRVGRNGVIIYSYRMKNGDKKNKEIYNKDLVSVKGWKSIGNRLDNKSRMSGFEFNNMNENNSIDNSDDESIESKDGTENLTLF